MSDCTAIYPAKPIECLLDAEHDGDHAGEDSAGFQFRWSKPNADMVPAERLDALNLEIARLAAIRSKAHQQLRAATRGVLTGPLVRVLAILAGHDFGEEPNCIRCGAFGPTDGLDICPSAPTPAAVPGLVFGEPDAAVMLLRLLRERVGDMPRHEECLTFNGRPSLTPSDDGDWLKRSDVLAALDPSALDAARLKGGE